MLREREAFAESKSLPRAKARGFLRTCTADALKRRFHHWGFPSFSVTLCLFGETPFSSTPAQSP
jgi:hypothetical protein